VRKSRTKANRTVRQSICDRSKSNFDSAVKRDECGEELSCSEVNKPPYVMRQTVVVIVAESAGIR
jgi:hypothetical protein